MAACAWSAENATKAFLYALKMGKRGKEPNVAEFISAFAAGNSAQLMVMACAGNTGSTTLALAAAYQTGGRAVCILRGHKELQASRKALGQYADSVDFVLGDAQSLLLHNYQDSDFVLVDCKMDGHKQLLQAAQRGLRRKDALLVEYNAIHSDSSMTNLKAHFLPIGEGLLVTRVAESDKLRNSGKKSRWLVKIDEFTGEEHVYRITSPQAEV